MEMNMMKWQCEEQNISSSAKVLNKNSTFKKPNHFQDLRLNEEDI